MPRPAREHQQAIASLVRNYEPDGYVALPEPGVMLDEETELSPDVGFFTDLDSQPAVVVEVHRWNGRKYITSKCEQFLNYANAKEAFVYFYDVGTWMRITKGRGAKPKVEEEESHSEVLGIDLDDLLD